MPLLLMALLIAALTFSGCTPLASPGSPVLPTSTPSPAPSASPTATIQWFPPTSTPAPLPTPLPTSTPAPRTDLGKVMLDDPMSRAAHWQLHKTEIGQAALGVDEITLALNGTKGYLTSFRDEPMLGDFYAEMIARASLCREKDAYGLVFRAGGSNNNYRFLVSCDGNIQIERVVNYQNMVIKSWTPSGQLPVGVPFELKLGVEARGSEFEFFINDVSQFSVKDPALTYGGLGIYARATGANVVTVSFSDLVVYALQPAE